MPALLPEIRVGAVQSDQVPLDLMSDGVLRYVWNGTFGSMLIEVRSGVAYVNGTPVTTVQALKAQTAPSDADRQLDSA